MTNNIDINDKTAFQATLNKMTELNNALVQKLNGTDAITSAITAAAGKGVVSGSPAGNGTKVASAYAGTVTALDTSTKNIAAQAKAASAAVTTAISDLTNLLNGLGQIDDAAADEIKKSG